MLDFLTISTKSIKRGTIEIYPKFIIPYKKSSDLMIKGSDFYAIWDEELGLWSTDERDAIRLIDCEIEKYYQNNYKKFDGSVHVLYMRDAESGMIDAWHKYCQKQLRDSFHMLDEKLVFSNSKVNKKDYASKRLDYPMENCTIDAYDRLISTLYTDEERHKIEWAIGSIVTGDSKKIQKFMVLYGAAGTGKSTILNIIQKLFDGYYSVFDAKALGSSNNSFALEAFKSNPLVAIQHDGDLSRIEDNTRLNSLVSHEMMTVNEKFKSTYSNQFKCFLFMGTNKPVKITDAKSGLIRRLIDVTPSGEKIPVKEYNEIMKRIPFELGGIACRCRDVYLEDPGYYDNYIPITMMGASNDFYNFVNDSFLVFQKENGTTLKTAWEMYKTYCDEANVSYPFSQRVFKEELKNYFKEYKERFTLEDGSRVRSYYYIFKEDKFDSTMTIDNEQHNNDKFESWLKFDGSTSEFDNECSDCLAQYSNRNGTPNKKWSSVKTILSDLKTSELHYVKVPENHIVIDFDIPDENGNKSLEKNMDAASKWPPTYAELSKSGSGIHLHYIYQGDPEKLSRIYDDYIEIKVFTGNSSLRRKLTKFNKLHISRINSGLPLKGDDKVINFDTVKNEKSIRTIIKRNLNKEYWPNTAPSVNFIYKTLEDAYNSGTKYDMTDLRNAVISFAAGSTHQSSNCLKLVNKMHFKSDEPSENFDSDEKPIVFYDVEVFPNLFLVNWKVQGEGKPIARMINPKPHEIEELVKFRLVGFNCRRYDNHILYARMLGYTEEQLFTLSQRIVNGSPNCFFGEAYNLSYTDVYDFSSKKQSLKKFEIELGIHHKELGLPWDQPVPENLWPKVAEYCDNDVIATEAVFNDRHADFIAREILADVAKMTVNDTTNSLSTRIIFGKNRKPQSSFNYRFLGDYNKDKCGYQVVTKDNVLYSEKIDDHTVFNSNGQPVFPGYEFDHGKSIYRGEEVGEGGYVYAEPGMYFNVALLDIASMHPSTIIAEDLFGPEFTKRFKEIVDARIAIKHKDFDKAKKLLGGALAKYLDDEKSAKDLAKALKIVINSVYGLTSARFENAFRDPRNVDNIVAKRGALFMINLKHAVQERGFTVAHIKTDSIKIPNATKDIIKFVMDYGKRYGYNFEHEATYERMCLVNDAVYIAKFDDETSCNDKYGYCPEDCKNDSTGGKWTPTGAQFAVPYVFKTLFSKEPIEFGDLCETKSVTSALYLDMNEKSETDHNYIFIGKVGQFCPIKSGCGGGVLCREAKNKDGEITYSAPPGTKGYRWLESELVKSSNKENDIDKSYYKRLVDEAISTISKYGDFEEFAADDKVLPDFPLDDESPY